MLTTQREIDTIHISINISSPQQLERLKTIFQRFGLKIKKLHWEKCIFNLEEYASYLNLLPNLVELYIKKWHLSIEETGTNETPFNLGMLQKLVVIDNDFRMELLLQKIPRDVLCEVVFEENRFLDFANFFDRQQNITKLKIHKKFTLGLQKLSHLSFEPWNGDDVIDMLRGQDELVFLEVMQSYRLMKNDKRWTEIFEEVCDLKNLQVLKIDIESVNIKAISRIQKLQNLRELQMTDNDSGFEFDKTKELELIKKLEAFAYAHMSTITKLSLKLPNTTIPDKTLRALSKKFSIESLKIVGNFFSLETILHNFRSLTSLDATYKTDGMNLKDNYYYRQQCVTVRYPNMKHLRLEISDQFTPSFISAKKFLNFLEDLSSLESLEAVINFRITQNLVEEIFAMLPQLTSLSLTQNWNEKEAKVKFNISFMIIVFQQKNLELFQIEDKVRDLKYDEGELQNIFRHRYKKINYEKRKVKLERKLSMRPSITDKYFE